MSKYLRVMGLCFSSSIFIAVTGFVTTVAWTTHLQAQDDVCDGLTGDAFGLCDAYCNAMKCGTDQQKASDKACYKVLTRFRSLSTELYPCNDPCADLVNNPDNECPCYFYDIALSADCWAQIESNAFYRGPRFSTTALPSFDECQLTQCTAMGQGCAVWGPLVTHNDGNYSCEYLAVPPACDVDTYVYQDISPEQFLTCLCRLEWYATDLSKTVMIYDPSGNQLTSFSCQP